MFLTRAGWVPIVIVLIFSSWKRDAMRDPGYETQRELELRGFGAKTVQQVLLSNYVVSMRSGWQCQWSS